MNMLKRRLRHYEGTRKQDIVESEQRLEQIESVKIHHKEVSASVDKVHPNYSQSAR